MQAWQEVGGLVGRVLLALLAFASWAAGGCCACSRSPASSSSPSCSSWPPPPASSWLKWGIFLCGLVTVAQFSFWGNYLPRVYPTHLRGTGESFAANVGGRMFGTSAAFVTTTLASSMPGGSPSVQLAYAAALVGFVVYAVGFTASFWLPEPKREELPE